MVMKKEESFSWWDIHSFLKPFFWRVCYSLIIIELLSLIAFFSDSFRAVVLLVISLAVFLAALKDIRYGLYVALAELFIGGFGYLFWIEIGGFRLSFRLALFSLLFLAGIIHIIRRRKITLSRWSGWPFYVAFIFVVIGGVVNGVLQGYSAKDVFLDMNGYLYYGLFFVFFEAVHSWETVTRVMMVWLASLLVSFWKVVFVLYIFTHQFDQIFVGLIYRWVRDTRVGEITSFSFFYRIFFQSHIYAVILLLFFFFILALYFLPKQQGYSRKFLYIWISWSLMSWFIITLGYSRSFWIGLVLSFMVSFVVLWRLFHLPLRRFFLLALLQGGIALVALLAIGIVVNLPGLPQTSSSDFSAFSFLEERTSDVSEERAAGSRFALLSPLLQKIGENPWLGTGFGTVVSYQSKDPRAIAAANGGLYTTYSFEWAYLDTVSEVGVAGLLVYFIFLGYIVRSGVQIVVRDHVSSPQGFFAVVSLLGIFVLFVVHIFTPYLNHPLGIGYSMFIAAVFYYFHSLSKI